MSLVPDAAAMGGPGIRAVGDVKLLALPAAGLSKLFDLHPEIGRRVLSNIIAQLQVFNNRCFEVHERQKRDLEDLVHMRTHELENVGQRIRGELLLAQSIQRNLLPEKHTNFPGLSIATEYLPCEELGGDVTGLFRIDETRIGVYGGDVCGHGVYAAMLMSYVKKLVETSIKRVFLNRQYVVKPPGAVLTSINQSFIEDINLGNPEIYLTIFLGVLDMRTLSFEYSSAGTHIPPLVISERRARELYEISDFPIGHVPRHEYATARIRFAPGDIFLFASDGVIEATRDGEPFGMDRLKEEVLRILQDAGELNLAKIVSTVRGYIGNRQPDDDMCLLSMAFTPPDGAAR
jgi:sigma-B regulation protein RsbU (phosphoserine phosphatase)